MFHDELPNERLEPVAEEGSEADRVCDGCDAHRGGVGAVSLDNEEEDEENAEEGGERGCGEIVEAFGLAETAHEGGERRSNRFEKAKRKKPRTRRSGKP